MEEAFSTLKSQKKNNVDGIIQWMKDAKIIDGKNITEEKVRKTLGDAKGDIEIDKFSEAMEKLSKDNKSSVDSYVSKLNNTGMVVESAFEKLKRDGKDNVDSIIQWMKDSKLIGTAKESEEKARKLLSDVDDKSHVELEKFKQVASKMAEDSEKGIDKVINLVQEQGPRLMNAFQAATSAFKDVMKND